MPYGPAGSVNFQQRGRTFLAEFRLRGRRSAELSCGRAVQVQSARAGQHRRFGRFEYRVETEQHEGRL